MAKQKKPVQMTEGKRNIIFFCQRNVNTNKMKYHFVLKFNKKTNLVSGIF